MGEEMAEKKAAAEKEVELLRKAVEESVSLARVEVDVEVPDTENFCEKKCQDNADVGNSDPDSTGELDDELGNLREINSKYRPFRDTNVSDRTETASVKLLNYSIYHPPGCGEGEGEECVGEARQEGASQEAGGEGRGERQDEIQEEQQRYNCKQHKCFLGGMRQPSLIKLFFR